MRRLFRLLPTLLDFALVYFIVLVIGVNFQDLGAAYRASGEVEIALFWLLIFIGVTVFYNAFADILLNGRSIGKWALGFAPFTLDGGSTTKGQHLKRFAFKLAGLCLFRGTRDEGVPLHDKKAGIVFVSRLMLLQPGSGSRWTLRIIKGTLAGKTIPLDRLRGFRATGAVKIGRDRAWADVPLADEGISRRHAQLQLERGSLTLVDLESRNGTFIDGQRLRPKSRVLLRARTQVMFGPVTAILEPR